MDFRLFQELFMMCFEARDQQWVRQLVMELAESAVASEAGF